MSTRSLIAIENTDGTIKSIHCHSDGYPKHNGKILQNHYNQRDLVKRLIALGNLSFLDEKIDPSGEHSFYSHEKGVTIAYHRDRRDEWDSWDNMKPLEFESLDAFLSSDFGGQDAVYVYLFTKKDVWAVYNAYSKKMRTLSKVVK